MPRWIGTTHGGVGLAARLNVSLPGMEQESAQSLVDAASHVCPSSLATKAATLSEIQGDCIGTWIASREAQHA